VKRIDPVTAVIPVHNRADLLERLLVTIQAQTVAFAEVLAVDNGSTDHAAAVASRFGCRVLPMGSNLGFARAVNAGWAAAGTEWVAVLNSDVELDPCWLERLLAESGGAGFATGLILQYGTTGQIDGTFDLVSRAGCAWRAGHGGAVVGGTGQAIPIQIAPATACLYRREVLQRLGGFDESYGSYLEDVDLGLRCVAAGISGVYVPGARAWHRGSATFGKWDPRVVRLLSRNQLRLVGRHYDRALFRSCGWNVLVGQLLWGAVALRHGAGRAWLQGKVEGLRDFRLDGVPSPAVRRFLDASEREIRANADGAYWNWYFRLVPKLVPSPRENGVN
jgi:GT2 family glycosyltransferase